MKSNFMNRSRRHNQQRSKGFRDPLERRMDQLVESGRQFVDGVAGNRPGQRRKSNSRSFNDMGRWMGEKIDWFFEDEDEWTENIDSQIDIEEMAPLKKRPLTAVSLRVPKAISASEQKNNDSFEEWPDEESFRVERWERADSPNAQNFIKTKDNYDLYDSKDISGRPLPKSSRRKN